MNWLTKNLGESIGNVLELFLDFFAKGLQILFDWAQEIWNDKAVENVGKAMTGIAFTLVITMVLKNILCIYILETDGDADSDPMQQLVKAAEAVALITVHFSLFDWLMKLVDAAYALVTISVADGEDILFSVKGYIGNVLQGDAILILVLFLFLLLFGFIAVAFKAVVRGAELALMKILFPLFCIDLLSTNRERWNAFLTSYLVTAFGYIIQVFCYRMSLGWCLKGLGSYHRFLDKDMVIGIAWLYMALKAPKWLEKFCYSSGIGHMAAGGIRTAAFMLPSVMMRVGR